MSRRRPGISAGHSRISWAAKRMDVSAVRSEPFPVVLDPPARVHHPVIDPAHSTWYRVLRAYRVADGVDWECIGEFPTALAAMLFANAELGHAIVNDWHAKRYYVTGQPIEDRR